MEVFSPPPQDIHNVTLKNSDIEAYLGGNSVTNFEKYTDANAVITNNFEWGGCGWMHYDLKRYLHARDGNECVLYDRISSEYKGKKSKFQLGINVRSQYNAYNHVWWAEMKDYQFVDLTKTRETFIANERARKTKTTAEKVFGLFGITESDSPQPIIKSQFDKVTGKKYEKTALLRFSCEQ